MSRKKKLQKKIAVAVSVVNILNVCAPMVLPYVNMTRDLSARGGYMEPIQGGARFAAAGALADAVQAVMPEKTAEAAEQTIPDGDTKSAAWTENGGTMTEGDMQTINSGGTGTVENMSGTQTINSGGTGTVTTLNGTQIINDGGTGTIVTVSKGYQTINSGGTGTIVTMNGGNQYVSGSGTVTNLNSGGWQIVENGGTGTVTNLNSSGGQTIWDGGAGTITTMNGGRQKVNDGGTGTVTTMNGGYQHVNDGGTGTISTMSYGYQYVSSGGTGTVDTMTVDTMSDGYQYVSSGGTGTISTMSCGNQDVSGGGTVITMISGYQDVKVGGTGTVTTMNDGGQRVRVGGTGTVTTMNGGSQYICSGGTGTVTTINGGTQYISGGTGTVETIDGGTQTIEDGGTGTVSTMNGGTQTIEDGGTGTVSSLMSGATQIVSSGGTSLNTIVKSGGIIEEDGSGGKVTGASFEAGGIHRLASGATSTGLSIAGHILELGNGGTAINATVQDGGTAQVLAGGVMSGATVNNGGMQIVSGGTSFVTNLNSGGTQIVSGGTSYVTNLNSGGIVSVAFDVLHQKNSDTSPIHIGDGGTALLLDQGGTLVLDHKYQYGISATNGVVELQSGGKTWDATAGPTTKLYGVFDSDNKQTASGLMIVHSGAEAGDTVISAGGMQIVEGQAGGDYASGGSSHVTYTNISAGGMQIVKSGAIASRTYIHPQHGQTVLVGGTQIVQGGATATSTHINSKTSAFEYESISVGGTQIVESGGTANTTYIHPKGTQIISGGGTANDTIINLNKTESNTTSNNFEYESISVGGTQIVQSGGMASNTYIYSKGTQIISNGGTAANTTIKGGGVQNVASGGTATDTTVDVGGTQIYQNAIISGGSNYVLGTASGGTIISGATQEVKGQAFDTVVNGTQIVNGGTATDTTINSGGTQIATEGGNLAGTQTVNFGGVASGGALTGTQTVYGTARATTISSGGTQYVSSGGTASGVTINYWGYQYVSSGGVASGTIINSEGYQYVYSGGTAVSTTISNGTQNVNSGGTAASTTINGGIQNVFNGGTVVSTTISGGNQGVNSGGVASGTTISSGVQHVFSGGTTKELTIHSGGTQVCLEGARMSGVTLDGGTLSMNSMTKASGTLQGHGGVYDISVLSVGGADNFSSVVVSGGSIYTSNGFVIDNGGSMKVDNTGATSNTTVKSGGMMSVLGGGTANGATLDGGTLDIASGAKASGTVGGHGTVVYDGGSGQISLGGTDNFSSFTVSGGTLETQNGFQICSSGGITVNNGGTMIAGGDVMVQTSGTLTVSSGGSFSATNISAVNGGEVSMSGGVLQAAEDIAIDQALTNAYGSVSAGGTLTLSAGATQPGSGKQLNLSAGKDVNISGNVTVTDLSAGDNITAGGKAVNATNISAGGAIAAGSITATNVSASGSISATDNISADSISAGDTLSAGGDITAGTLALSTVPASGMAVSAGGNANITNLNVSGFDPGTSGALISAGGTVSEMTVNGKALTAGKTVYMNETATQPKAGIDAAYTDCSFSLAADQRSLTYDAHNTYTNIAFSTISWNADSAYYEAAATDRFTGDTAISAENLSFTFTEESQKAALSSGSTMTLFANATGLPAGMDVNYGSGKTNVTQEIGYNVSNGAVLTGTLTGTVATVAGATVTSGTTAAATAGAIEYTVSSMTLDSVDLAGWDGATASAVPGGWTANGNGVVVAGSFATAGVASGDILTATTGFFADKNIDAAIKYRQGEAFSEAQSGKIVNLAGHKYGGVKAEDSGAKLTYYAMEKKVETAAFNGSVDWNSGEAYFTNDNDNYKFSGATKIDASGLAFEQTSTVLATGDSMTLISADGLTANNSVTQPTAGTVAIAYTDGAGISFDATAAGEVKAADKAVKYAVTGVMLDSVDLAGWDGATASAVPTGWTANTSGVAVDTDGIKNLPNLAAGTTKEILTTDTANYFSDEKISETNKYKAYDFTPSAVNGVTLSGKQSKGVKTSDDKSDLVYAVGEMDVSDVSFSTMDWGEGRTATADYDFANVATVNACDLAFNFTEEQKAALSNTSTMTLLSDATNLAADKTVTGANRTQQIEYSVANGAALTGTLTGTVSTAAGTVNYTATGMTLDSVDLAGWDGATASAVPTGWTANTSGVAVDTEGMTNLPNLAAGTTKEILTTDTPDYFSDDKISETNKYKSYDFTPSAANGVTLSGKQSKGVKASDDKSDLVYAVGKMDVSDVSFSTMDWGEGRTATADYDFAGVATVNASGLAFNFKDEQKATLSNTSTMTLLSDATNLAADKTVTGANRTQQIDYSVANGAALTGTLTGTVSTAAGTVNYTATGMTLDSVDLAGWDGSTASAVLTGWTANTSGVIVATEDMTNLPTDVPAGGSKAILTGTAENTFLDDSIGGSNKYGKNPDRVFTETDKVQNAVVIKGTQDKGVRAADTGKSLVYAVGTKDVTSVSLGAVTWQKDAVLLDESDKGYNYSAISSLDYGGFDVEYEDGVPETVAAGDTMTLLKANETLQEMAAVEKQKQYKVTRQSGDLTMYTVDAVLTGNLTAGSGRVAFTAAANQATKLTFENVNWLDSGALIDHKTTLANVSFDGAAIDTSKINFINKQGLKANQQMTLVSDFGGKPGTVTGTRYKVGTAFEGEGSAEMSGDDLIFKTKTSAGNLSEETHTSVMAMEAGVALLAAGSEHVGSVMNDLGLAANAGPDGTSTAASVGGGVSRYETGSHVNSNFWNAVVAVGRKNETEKGSLEYGFFGEYGKGNYTLHSNAGRGDGNSHYAGGGLLAKWTNRHNVYAEASFRLGRMSDSASDILHDGAGNGYGYDVHANYYGAHVGIGKVFHYNGGRSLDVYGKYFYTKRDGVSFNAGADRYNLDSVASSVLRIGAKYGTTDKKWNWYGGLAYEYEFDGEASGTVNGTAIRSAGVKGGSVRGEIGLRMDATKDNPWKADIAIYGYGGRHRGFGGSISVAYMF